MVDSKFFTDSIIKDATIKAEEILSVAKKSVQVENSTTAPLFELDNSKIQEELNKIEASYSAKSRIDSNNIILAAKQKALNDAYSAANKKILSLNDKDYQKFIEDLITKNAGDGDSVIIASTDKKRITKSLVDAVAKKSKLKISLSDKTHSYSGGVLLEGKISDKNLSIETLLKNHREYFEIEIANILFSK